MKSKLTMIASLIVCAGGLQATTVYEATGTLNSLPEDATASFVVAAGSITVTINDLESNPTSDIQDVSDVEFQLSGVTTGGTLTSSSGTQLTVNSDGTYTVGSTGTTNWLYSVSGGTFTLTNIGNAMAEQTIIGTSSAGNYTSGTYSNANSSITNGVHAPFLENGASFVISNANITANTTVTSAILSFGTEAGSNITGVLCTSNCGGSTQSLTPEPFSFALVGSGLSLLGLMRLRRR